MSSSRPARGAWVEILQSMLGCYLGISRAPQGARGLKFAVSSSATENFGRAPQGARGLKYNVTGSICAGIPVAPRKGRVG